MTHFLHPYREVAERQNGRYQVIYFRSYKCKLANKNNAWKKFDWRLEVNLNLHQKCCTANAFWFFYPFRAPSLFFFIKSPRAKENEKEKKIAGLAAWTFLLLFLDRIDCDIGNAQRLYCTLLFSLLVWFDDAACHTTIRSWMSAQNEEEPQWCQRVNWKSIE